MSMNRAVRPALIEALNNLTRRADVVRRESLMSETLRCCAATGRGLRYQTGHDGGTASSQISKILRGMEKTGVIRRETVDGASYVRVLDRDQLQAWLRGEK